jgi:hypothetical protein
MVVTGHRRTSIWKEETTIRANWSQDVSDGIARAKREILLYRKVPYFKNSVDIWKVQRFVLVRAEGRRPSDVWSVGGMVLTGECGALVEWY